MLFFASQTGIEVSRDNSEVSALSCVGSRCCTSTKAMPVSLGSAFNNCVIASRPPAEAPIPTMGNESSGFRFAFRADEFWTVLFAGRFARGRLADGFVFISRLGDGAYRHAENIAFARVV